MTKCPHYYVQHITGRCRCHGELPEKVACDYHWHKMAVHETTSRCPKCGATAESRTPCKDAPGCHYRGTVVCTECHFGEKFYPAQNAALSSAGQKCLGFDIKEVINILCNTSQLLSGWSQDGTAWSNFDEECRQGIIKLLKAAYAENGEKV
jgi:hypothetical protein